MPSRSYSDVSWERMSNAVEKIRQRLVRAVRALEAARVQYAGVSRVDEAAVRNTRDVDILLRRPDFSAARAALESAGFVYRHAAGVDMFLDGPGAKARDAVHIVFAAEKVRPGYAEPAPDVGDSEDAGDIRLMSLDALVRMKLTSFRDKDRVHLRDMIDVGLIDDGWVERVPGTLRGRLKEVLEYPEG